VGFLSELKDGCGGSPQISSLAFLIKFSGILQPKNTEVGLSGSQKMLFEKNTYLLLTCANNNEE